MALAQPMNPDANMATGDDLMEFSTGGRTPMQEDDIDIDIDETNAPLNDQAMDEDATNNLIDDEMGDAAAGEQPTFVVTGEDGKDLELDDAVHEAAQTPESIVDMGSAQQEAQVLGGGATTTEPADATDTILEPDESALDEVGDADEEEEEAPAGKGEDNVATQDFAAESDDDSPDPPQRRPAGKGPAVGRAPQKGPVTSTAVGEDPENESDGSNENSQDDEEVPSGANATTDPSFSESAKHDSESEESTGEGHARVAPAGKQPVYPEDHLSDSDSDSLVEHGPVHSIIVDYQGSKMSLFPPQPDHEQHESFLLEDEALCHEPVSHMLSECRQVLRETVLDGEELVLNIPCLGVSISEQIAETMSTTMTELVDLFLSSSYNDGVGAPAALRVTLDTKEKCIARIDSIRSMIAAGKGLSHIIASLSPGQSLGPLPVAELKPPAVDDFTAGGENSAHVGEQLNAGNPGDVFAPSDQQDFEQQFDVQTPGGEEPNPLGVAAANNNPDFLDFTSPGKPRKVADDNSNFNDVFAGDFDGASNLVAVPGDGTSAGGATLGDFGTELGGSDFVETFNTTNDSKSEAAPPQAGESGAEDWIQNPEDDFVSQVAGEDAAQAAEDAFTFIDHDAGGNDPVEVGSEAGAAADVGNALLDDITSSPAGMKRARPDDEDRLDEGEDPTAQAKRARAG